MIHGRESGELDDAQVWVSDFQAEEWVIADEAYFVPTRGVASPMGYGILAFSTEESASAFASDLDGEVIGWETLRQLPVSPEDMNEDMDMSEETER